MEGEGGVETREVSSVYMGGERVGGVCRGCFFFNDTATTEIYTLSLHDALPIFLNRKPLEPPITK